MKDTMIKCFHFSLIGDGLQKLLRPPQIFVVVLKLIIVNIAVEL